MYAAPCCAREGHQHRASLVGARDDGGRTAQAGHLDLLGPRGDLLRLPCSRGGVYLYGKCRV